MERIVFFDGVCNLCNSSVDLLIKYDKQKKLKYAPLQGESAKKYGLDQSTLSERDQSIVYYRNGKSYIRSEAALEILSDIFSWGFVFMIFKIIPRFIRDGVYKFIAKNRYEIFGKKASCRLPTDEEKELFLP